MGSNQSLLQKIQLEYEHSSGTLALSLKEFKEYFDIDEKQSLELIDRLIKTGEFIFKESLDGESGQQVNRLVLHPKIQRNYWLYGIIEREEALFLIELGKNLETPYNIGLQNLIIHDNHLVKLVLPFENIESLPDSLGVCKHIQEMILHHNNLTTLPNSIGNLINLKILDLDNNKLSELPESIKNLDKLEELWLRDNNSLTKIPNWVLRLPNLKVLRLEGTLDIQFNLKWARSKLQSEDYNVQIQGLIALEKMSLTSDDLEDFLPFFDINDPHIKFRFAKLFIEHRKFAYIIIQKCQYLLFDKRAFSPVDTLGFLSTEDYETRTMIRLKELILQHRDIMFPAILKFLQEKHSGPMHVMCESILRILFQLWDESKGNFSDFILDWIEQNDRFSSRSHFLNALVELDELNVISVTHKERLRKIIFGIIKRCGSLDSLGRSLVLLVPQPDDELLTLLSSLCNDCRDLTRSEAFSTLIHYWDPENTLLRNLLYKGAFLDFDHSIRRTVRSKLQDVDPTYPSYFKKFQTTLNRTIQLEKTPQSLFDEKIVEELINLATTPYSEVQLKAYTLLDSYYSSFQSLIKEFFLNQLKQFISPHIGELAFINVGSDWTELPNSDKQVLLSYLKYCFEKPFAIVHTDVLRWRETVNTIVDSWDGTDSVLRDIIINYPTGRYFSKLVRKWDGTDPVVLEYLKKILKRSRGSSRSNSALRSLIDHGYHQDPSVLRIILDELSSARFDDMWTYLESKGWKIRNNAKPQMRGQELEYILHNVWDLQNPLIKNYIIDNLYNPEISLSLKLFFLNSITSDMRIQDPKLQLVFDDLQNPKTLDELRTKLQDRLSTHHPK